MQQRHGEVQRAEACAVWRADREAVKAERDVLADELHERYPVLAGELVDLLGRIRELDPEVRRVNSARPADAGAEAPLLSVELHARKLKNICRDISPDELSLDKDLVLPEGGVL